MIMGSVKEEDEEEEEEGVINNDCSYFNKSFHDDIDIFPGLDEKEVNSIVFVVVVCGIIVVLSSSSSIIIISSSFAVFGEYC